MFLVWPMSCLILLNDLHRSPPPGGDQDVLDLLLGSFHAVCLYILHGVSLMYLLSLKQDVLCYSVKATPSNVTHVWRPMRMTATDRAQPPALSTLMPAPPSQDRVSKHTPRKALTQV